MENEQYIVFIDQIAGFHTLDLADLDIILYKHGRFSTTRCIVGSLLHFVCTQLHGVPAHSQCVTQTESGSDQLAHHASHTPLTDTAAACVGPKRTLRYTPM